MKALVIFALVLVATLQTGRARFQISDTQQDTIKRKFVACPFANEDAKLQKNILDELNKHAEDGERYYKTSVIYPADSTFKVVNVYGEGSGATYNPFALTYLVKDGKIIDTPLSGETFRVDAINVAMYTLYIDAFWRLNSNPGTFDVIFKPDSLEVVKSTRKQNYARNFIGKSKESPQDFPKFDFSSRITANLADLLQIDTARIAPNDYYFPSDDAFFTRDFNPAISATLYYRHHNGDEIEKILRVQKGDAINERFLAKVASDPVMRLSTEFVSDSIFRETAVYEETVADEKNLMAYEQDSIITDYFYNDNLEFTEIAKDSFRSRREYFSENNQRKSVRRIEQGKPFALNGRRWYWKFYNVKPYDQGKPMPFVIVNYTLFNSESGQPAIDLPPETVPEARFDYSDRLSDFVDVNLDGHLDAKLYDAEASGSAGSYENVYLYDPATGKFNRSDLFSGYDLYVDSRNRIVYSYGKSGFYNFSIGRIYLDKKSRVRFTELFKCDDKNGKLVLSYRKSKGSKTITSKVKTVPMENFGTREEIESELFKLGKQ
jgi:hypothetical protein